MRKFISKVFISVLITLSIIPSAFAEFTDVIPQSLFYDAITYFSNSYPIIDTSKEEFRPLHKVNKAEFFKLIYLSAGFTGTTNTNLDIPYYDINGDEWFAPYIDEALKQGLIVFSEEDPYFHPTDNITRAEALDLIVKTSDLNAFLPEYFAPSYIDISLDDWYASLSEFAYNYQLLHDYRSNAFKADSLITRAETLHILYKLHIAGLAIPKDYQLSSDVFSFGPEDLTRLEEFEIFNDAWSRVNSEYIYSDEIDQEALMQAAIYGMISTLGDPYSEYYLPVDSSDYIQSLEGTIQGIGIYIDKIDDKIVIITPIKGSPADEANIKPNDVIEEIDEQNVEGLSLDQISQLIKGPEGTSVKLKIKRGSRTLTKTITRQTVDIPYVESEIRDSIGVIYYYQFTSVAQNQFLQHMEDLVDQNIKGLVIDLRNNPGGFINIGQQLSSSFIPEGLVFTQFQFGTTQKEKLYSTGPGEYYDLPIVIIINEGTASASEMVALALKEHLGAKIIGTQSYGKGKIQEIINYPDGSALKLTVAKWFSPNGTDIDEIGITPDIVVEMTDSDILNNRDPQLDKAIDLLN